MKALTQRDNYPFLNKELRRLEDVCSQIETLREEKLMLTYFLRERHHISFEDLKEYNETLSESCKDEWNVS